MISILQLAALRRNINRRVRAEIAWAKCEDDPRGQLHEHRPASDEVHKARAALERQLDKLTYKGSP